MLVALLTVNSNAATKEISFNATIGENKPDAEKVQIPGGVVTVEEGNSTIVNGVDFVEFTIAEDSGMEAKEGYQPVYLVYYLDDELTSPSDPEEDFINPEIVLKIPVGSDYVGIADPQEKDYSSMTPAYVSADMSYENGFITIRSFRCYGMYRLYLKKAEAKATVVSAGEGRAETVPASTFEAAKAAGTPVTVSVASLATWNFASIQNVMDFNPNLVASTTKKAKVQSTLIEEAEFIDFEHSGVLPGKASVTVNIGTERFGAGDKTLWVYYYNPENKGFEHVGMAAYSNGAVTMELDHCSTYALMENELVLGGGGPAPEAAPALAPAAQGALDKEPKAGEMFILPVAILSVISLGVVAIINKK